MTAELTSKIRRLYLALAQVRNGDVLQVRPQRRNLPTGFAWTVDFNQGKSAEELQDRAFNLIANIASIKDHLKNYCDARGKPFGGEKLINSNLNVALVHDLWNADKHGSLDHSRSGKFPRLSELQQGLVLSAGTQVGSAVSLQMDMSGNIKVEADGGGKAELVLDGNVVDFTGNRIGGFQDICEVAVEAWSKELSAAGIPVALIW